MQSYYGIADPRIYHYGVANTIMEGLFFWFKKARVSLQENSH